MLRKHLESAVTLLTCPVQRCGIGRMTLGSLARHMVADHQMLADRALLTAHAVALRVAGLGDGRGVTRGRGTR